MYDPMPIRPFYPKNDGGKIDPYGQSLIKSTYENEEYPTEEDETYWSIQSDAMQEMLKKYPEAYTPEPPEQEE